MTKWHNGPNGPGLCKATKGKCPFGGAESHFDSKEAAMQDYQEKNEKEFGLIPNQNETKGPWGHNSNEWEGSAAYGSKGIKEEDTFVRTAEGNKDKIEFFSRVVSTDGSSHIISKGTIDLKSKKVSQRAVEAEYGVKRKDNPVQFMKNVVSFYGGDNFDDDPIYLNARRSKNIAQEIEKIYLDHGIPVDKKETIIDFSNSSQSSGNVIFPTEEEFETRKPKKRGYSDEDYQDI